jgi:hypothetical protein
MMVTGLPSQVIAVFVLGAGPLAAARATPVSGGRLTVSLGRIGGVTPAVITWQTSTGGAMDGGRAGRVGAGR